ncbi:MAG: Na+/H+ antiporter NhaC family protein [Candidatus Babeliales bacterium]
MQLGWLSLVPPLLVLTLAIATKRVIPALIAGIITAACIASNLSFIGAFKLIAHNAWQQVNQDNIYTFAFLITLGSLIALLERTGGTQAYANLVQRRLKSKKQAELGSIGLSLCFMIDDFFSSITVGSIMRPLTDKYHIAHAKLAYLIDALASPLVILIPISSWIAMLLAQLEQSGISANTHNNPLILADPFATYIASIPFIFYSFITLCAVIYIVQCGISFGPMHKHEHIAATTGNLVGGKQDLTLPLTHVHTKGAFIDFLFPFLSLFTSVFITLLYLGNFNVFGGNNTLIEAFQNTDIFIGLFLGGLLAFSASLLFSLLRNTITIATIPHIIKEGYDSMAPSIAVLFLAWTFGSLLRTELHTGAYLAQLVMQSFSVALLPCLFFIITLITCVAIGSSWGTIAIMIPLAVPMLAQFSPLTPPLTPESVPLLYPLIAAIFAGAVAGDHVSPIASTTLMSAASASCYLSDHVHTQIYYALPVIFGTCVSFLIAGLLATQPFWFNIACSLSVGLLLALLLLYLANKKLK